MKVPTRFWVAADLLAQAEHDVLAAAVLITPSAEMITKVQVEVEKQLQDRNRRENHKKPRWKIAAVPSSSKDLEEGRRAGQPVCPRTSLPFGA